MLKLVILIFCMFSCARNTSENNNLIPETPQNFSVSRSDNQLQLIWSISNNSDIRKYNIYQGLSPNTLMLRDSTLGYTNNSKTLTDFVVGTVYFFAVTSVTSNGIESTRSSIASINFSSASSLDSIYIMTWNIEWFNNSSNGPDNDNQQFDRVKQLLRFSNPDICALEEIADTDGFAELDDSLFQHKGIISTYSWTQKTALFFKNEKFTFVASENINGIDEDAGRPPLKVVLKHTNSLLNIIVIVIHAKASSDINSYNKRVLFSHSLKSYIDNNHASDRLILIGDFNDQLYESISSGKQSPYKNFVDASSYYLTVTYNLNATSQSEHSYPSYSSNIDHIIFTNEFISVFQNSLNVLENEYRSIYSDFLQTVSDHCPVSIYFKL